MKILVAYDSAFADVVVPEAVKMAKAFDALVYLVRTCPQEATERGIAELEVHLKELKKTAFEAAGIECEPHILIRGLEPGEDIVQYAREKAVDQIIIGVQKQSKVGKIIFGSTAQYIILEAPCPVLAVKQ